MNEVQHHRGPMRPGVHMAPGIALATSAVDHRPGTGSSRCFNETAPWSWSTTARSTTTSIDPRAHGARARVSHAQRHRGHRARLGILGRACVDVFAACSRSQLWDQRQQTLFLARDRLGVKRCTTRNCPRSVAVQLGVEALMTHGGSGATSIRARSRTFALVMCPAAHHLTSALKLAPVTRCACPRPNRAGTARYWDVRFTAANKIRRRRAGRAAHG